MSSHATTSDGIAALCRYAFSEAIENDRRSARPGASSTARPLDPEAAADHLDRLVRAALALCGSRQLAEDLVQETYVKVLSRPRFLRHDDDLPYLMRALRNAWYTHLRSEGARGQEFQVGEGDREPASPRRLGDPELSAEVAAVLEAVAALPKEFREVIAAVDLAGLKYGEAAAALEIPTGTVMSRLYRARERLATTLDGSALASPLERRANG